MISGRSPHGERGLKITTRRLDSWCHVSLSSWRAWIEMTMSRSGARNAARRSPHGERGLKFFDSKQLHAGQVALLMESVD